MGAGGKPLFDILLVLFKARMVVIDLQACNTETDIKNRLIFMREWVKDEDNT